MSSSVMEIKIEYKDLFEYSLDFLFIIDLSGRILDVNKFASETLGYSKEEILTMIIVELLIGEDIQQLSNNKKEGGYKCIV